MALGERDDEPLSDISKVLWRERQLLELLVFKLEEEQLLLTACKARWFNFACREVEVVLQELRAAELFRAVQVEAAAARLNIGSCPSLRSLAQASPEPWASIFCHHLQAFLELTQELRGLSEHNCQLLGELGRASQRRSHTGESGELKPLRGSGKKGLVAERLLDSGFFGLEPAVAEGLPSSAAGATSTAGLCGCATTVAAASRTCPSLGGDDLGADLYLGKLCCQAALETTAMAINPSLAQFLS